jgi:hypothetical protein
MRAAYLTAPPPCCNCCTSLGSLEPNCYHTATAHNGLTPGNLAGGGGGGGDSVAAVADAWASVLEGRMLVAVATSAEGEAFRLRRLDMAKMLAGLGISAVYVQARAA